MNINIPKLNTKKTNFDDSISSSNTIKQVRTIKENNFHNNNNNKRESEDFLNEDLLISPKKYRNVQNQNLLKLKFIKFQLIFLILFAHQF